MPEGVPHKGVSPIKKSPDLCQAIKDFETSSLILLKNSHNIISVAVCMDVKVDGL